MLNTAFSGKSWLAELGHWGHRHNSEQLFSAHTVEVIVDMILKCTDASAKVSWHMKIISVNISSVHSNCVFMSECSVTKKPTT